MLNSVIVIISRIFSYFHSEDSTENIPSVTYRLIRYFGIKITYETTRELIKSDPDYPSLKSICNFLNNQGIINYALRLEESDLFGLDRPFLAHINDKGWKIILIYSIRNMRVIYIDSLKGKRIMNIQDFLKIWDGVILITEANATKGQIDYQSKKANEIIRNTIIYIVFATIFFIVLYGIFWNIAEVSGKLNTVRVSIIFIHILGLVFSLFLFQNELNINTYVTNKLCHISANSDCEAVTKSAVSRIFGNVTWADVGIIYFSYGLIVLSLCRGINSISLIKFFSILTIPFPIFSILYQWLKIKKWCPLCLSVQIILMIECIILMSSIKIPVLNTSIVFLSLLILMTVLILTLLVKFLLISEAERDHFKINHLKLKRDPALFEQQIKRATRISLPKVNTIITFGDQQSQIIITAFISPFCSACSKKFSEILELIKKEIRIKVCLVFPNTNDELASKLIKQVFLYAKSEKSNESLYLLEKWYKADKTLRYKIVNNLNGQTDSVEFEEMMNNNQKLFQIANIHQVPIIIVNDYVLPEIYSLQDIEFHIEFLQSLKKDEILINV